MHTYFKHPRSLLNVFLCRTVTISYMRNLHIALLISFREFKDFGKLSVLQKLRKRIHSVTFLHVLLLTCIYCVGCSAALVYNEMETLCTLHERHTYAMWTRKNSVLHVSVQDNVDTLDILLKLSVVSFILFYKQISIMCSLINQKSVQPECLQIDRKATTVTFYAGIYTSVEVQEWSKLIW